MYSVDIRKDFEPVAVFMHRFLKIAEAFSSYNNQDWSHLKNKEDFRRVYSLPDDIRFPIEKIYATGRDCAVSMSGKLRAFNYADEYPNLSSYIDSFEGGWVYEEAILNEIYEKARKASTTLTNCPWAVKIMLELFKDQLKLLDAVKSTLNIVKQSHLYMLEKGDAPVEKEVGITIGTIHGKVNIHSTDNSINTTSHTNTIFAQLNDAIVNSDIIAPVKDVLINNVRDMEKSCGKPGYLQAYKDFMQNAANHVSVIAPFIPAISVLLG